MFPVYTVKPWGDREVPHAPQCPSHLPHPDFIWDKLQADCHCLMVLGSCFQIKSAWKKKKKLTKKYLNFVVWFCYFWKKFSFVLFLHWVDGFILCENRMYTPETSNNKKTYQAKQANKQTKISLVLPSNWPLKQLRTQTPGTGLRHMTGSRLLLGFTHWSTM